LQLFQRADEVEDPPHMNEPMKTALIVALLASPLPVGICYNAKRLPSGSAGDLLL